MLAALFFCSEWSVSENSDSVAREGTTDTITSEARCAIRATVNQVSTVPLGLISIASPMLAELGSTIVRWGSMRGERTSLSSSLDGAHGDCELVAGDSGGASWSPETPGRCINYSGRRRQPTLTSPAAAMADGTIFLKET
jgi:hypothetical protein